MDAVNTGEKGSAHHPIRACTGGGGQVSQRNWHVEARAPLSQDVTWDSAD